MSLTICLDEHLQLPHYSGNEALRGHIDLQCFNPIEVQEIRLTFSGRAEAKISKVKGSAAPSGSYRSKCTLFKKEQILAHPGGEIMNTGSYSWPFEMTFPSHVGDNSDSSKWPEKPPFRSDPNHPLPPTFAVKLEDSLRKLNCVIEYQIKVEVFKPQKGLMGLGGGTAFTSEVLHLPFVPPPFTESKIHATDRMFEHHKEEVFSLRSLLLLQEYKGRTLGVQDKLRSWFSPGQLPSFSFRTTFSYPIRVPQSAPLAAFLTIDPIMEDSSVSSPPVISLQSLSITLISRTSARSGPSFMGTLSGEVDEKIEILSKDSLGMPVCGRVDLSQVFGSLVFRSTDVSFGTFNISRTYRLCVLGSFDCAGKQLKFHAPDLPIDIIPRENGREEGTTSPGYPLDDDYLPSYTSGILVNEDDIQNLNEKIENGHNGKSG